MSCGLTDRRTCSTFPGSYGTSALGGGEPHFVQVGSAETTAKNAKDAKKAAGWSASPEDI